MLHPLHPVDRPSFDSWKQTSPTWLFIARVGTDPPHSVTGPWPSGWSVVGHHRAQFASVMDDADIGWAMTVTRYYLCVDSRIVSAMPGYSVRPVAFGFEQGRTRIIVPHALAIDWYQYITGLVVQTFELSPGGSNDAVFTMLAGTP